MPQRHPLAPEVDPSGGTQVMESWGAGSVEIRAGGATYNLKPGMDAVVTIPVDPLQLASGVPPAPTIPLLYYDPARGVWIQEGDLKLTGSAPAWAYTAKVKHFSTILHHQFGSN